jgi:hypothetical protein
MQLKTARPRAARMDPGTEPVPDGRVRRGRAPSKPNAGTVCCGLSAGGKWIRTIGPPPEIVVDPSGSRRDHRANLRRDREFDVSALQGRLSTSFQSQCSTPGSDRWNLASTTFPDAGPMVRIRFPPAGSPRTLSPSPASRSLVVAKIVRGTLRTPSRLTVERSIRQLSLA